MTGPTYLQPQRQKLAWSIALSDVTGLGAVTSGYLALISSLPNASKVIGYSFKSRTQFAWGSGSGTVTLQVYSKSGSTYTAIGSASADLVATAVTDFAVLSEAATYASGVDDPDAGTFDLVLKVTSNNSNLNLLSAGAADIIVEIEYEMATWPFQSFDPTK